MLLMQIVLAQRPHREAADKGPRAMGLLELAPNGKAHLIPVTIMVNGEFYDASEYKASPVPMSLDTGTVYEAVKTGVSQGLFTVKGAIAGVRTWRGEGTWQSEAEMKAEAAKKKLAAAAEKSTKKKNTDEEEGGPPVLRRAGPAKSGSSDKAASDKSGSDGSKTSASVPSTPSVEAASSSGNTPPASTSKPPAAASADVPSPSSSSDEDDPNRPQLRRGKAPAEKVQPVTAAPQRPARGSQVATPMADSSAELQMIPAISDAGGPEARSFAFDVKEDESRKFRTEMLALAAVEVRARADSERSEMPATTAHTTTRKGKAAKLPDPTFEDLQLRVFDLSTSNEPVLVLTAKAHVPASKTGDNADSPTYSLTLVAREDIYGELHKALSNVTDNKHLDVLPRLDLIDAVDVDGDGRGELLFRRVSDVGSAYVVYRVIGNRLWPLFQGAIG
jgi:hypothetical protein